MKNYIVITKEVTDKYVSWKDSFYVRTINAFGVIYLPIEEVQMDDGWTACILEEGEVCEFKV